MEPTKVRRGIVGGAKNFRRLDRWVRRLTLNITDRGLLGRTPLETHVVICGFARSGSSLLQSMIRTCVDDARSFSTETAALVAAQRAARNQRFLVTKAPNDLDRIQRIRAHYAPRTASAHFLITVRDPRDVLTSADPRTGSDFAYRNPLVWEQKARRIIALGKDSDVTVVRYEDLVTEADTVQATLAERIGWSTNQPFSTWVGPGGEGGVAAGSFIDKAMGGPRPPDAARIGRWRQPEYAERMDEIREAIPALPDYIRDLGYDASPTR